MPRVSRASPAVASRVFLLSPANCGGERAQLLLRPQAQFPLAIELRSPAGARLRDVFQFMSGLYFRGKLAYSDRFARPPGAGPGALVIVPGAGLVSPDQRVSVEVLRAIAEIPVDVRDERYRIPLERDARRLARKLGRNGEAVLLGSVASGKYTEILLAIFRERLRFPTVFVGRGDMSRGGLMLRCARAGIEMDYAAVDGAVVHGQRPPRLPPIPRSVFSNAELRVASNVEGRPSSVAEAPAASNANWPLSSRAEGRVPSHADGPLPVHPERPVPSRGDAPLPSHAEKPVSSRAVGPSARGPAEAISRRKR